MHKAFKYRLYPTKEQCQLIDMNIDNARFVYNRLLGIRKECWEKTKQKSNKTYSQLKKDFPFLMKGDNLALANAQMHLNGAYNKFFAKPNEVGFPQFKSKHHCRLSYTTNNQKGSVRIENNKIKLPKIGFVKIKEHRPCQGLIKSVTVSHERSGEYFVSVLCLLPDEKPLPKTDKHIGIDLGLHVLSFVLTGRE